MSREVDIPQLVDNFPQIMWWESDELVPIICGAGVGTVFEAFTLGLVLGIALSVVYIRHKRNALPGALHHMVYWWGMFGLNSVFGNGLEREFEE
jgi:conjugal transfer pilus assembly protein TraL